MAVVAGGAAPRHLLSTAPRVVKQIKQGKFIEAFGYYERFVLRPFVEVLRLAYVPRKGDSSSRRSIGIFPMRSRVS